MLMPPTVKTALALPALSVAGSLVTLWLAPLPLSTLLVGHDATSERSSVQLKSTVTCLSYQPAVLGCVVCLPSSRGAVRSMFTPLTVACVVFPARSATSAEAPRFEPSPVIRLSAGWSAMPDSPSTPVQPMVTSPRYQPAPFGVVVGAPERAGAVLSTRIGPTVAALVFPATSAVVPATSWFSPSLATVAFGPQPAMPESASAQTKVTSTSLLFQPKPLAAGLAAPVIDGCTASTSTDIVRVASALPATSTLQ